MNHPAIHQQQPGLMMGQRGQQQQMVWMNRPPPIPGVPVGLEYLSQIDQMQIHQIPSLTEALIGWEKNNKYAIKSGSGQQVYFAAEESDTCMRFCCGSRRGFQIHIFDNFNQEIMSVDREFKACGGNGCFASCCDCCAHEITVYSGGQGGGEIMGYVRQTFSFFTANFDVLDENKNKVLGISSPLCIVDGVCCDTTFKVIGLDGDSMVGKIKKEFSGIINETFTNADRFRIEFPMDLSVKVKATLLGAVFMIDFMYYEKKQQSAAQNVM